MECSVVCVVICQLNVILYLGGLTLGAHGEKIQLFWQEGMKQECPAECALRRCGKVIDK